MAKQKSVADEDAKELAHEIHLGLLSLTKVFKPTEEFLNVFEKDMFLKSNPKAFPHVFHFLFWNLNTVEFNVRFLWPLHSDKTAEKEFRQSCIHYINDLNKKHKLGLQDVGNYIAVVPGGIKFMKVLASLIKLVQIETLKRYEKMGILEMPIEEIFNERFRKTFLRSKEVIERVGNEFKEAISKEIKHLNYKNDSVLRIISELEENDLMIEEDTRTAETVGEICGQMNNVCKIVTELEETCGLGANEEENKIDATELSEAMSRISQYYKWYFYQEETGDRLNSLKVLDFARKVAEEIRKRPISVQEVDLTNIVTQSQEISLILQNLNVIEKEFKQVKVFNSTQSRKHDEFSILNPLPPVIQPDRGYKIELIQPFECSYFKLRFDPHFTLDKLRLPLIDAIERPDTTAKSFNSLPSTSLNATSVSNCPSTLRKPMTTVKKRTRAAAVLRTIQKTNKKSRIKIEGLKEIAKNFQNDPSFASVFRWKKNMSQSRTAETSSSTLGNISKISDILSETPVIKFNSTSIFNSTTNDQVFKSPNRLSQVNQFLDITNSKNNLGDKGARNSLSKIIIEQLENQENICDLSDTILLD